MINLLKEHNLSVRHSEVKVISEVFLYVASCRSLIAAFQVGDLSGRRGKEEEEEEEREKLQQFGKGGNLWEGKGGVERTTGQIRQSLADIFAPFSPFLFFYSEIESKLSDFSPSSRVQCCKSSTVPYTHLYSFIFVLETTIHCCIVMWNRYLVRMCVQYVRNVQ